LHKRNFEWRESLWRKMSNQTVFGSDERIALARACLHTPPQMRWRLPLASVFECQITPVWGLA
jgi:hypothetical protein